MMHSAPSCRPELPHGGAHGVTTAGVIFVAAMVLAVLCMPRQAAGYSVLAHEANIDALWDPTIKAMLHARFPEATPEQLSNARAYAYGGCVIQDLGYYPFGSHFFSNLLHYVRTGDFISALIRRRAGRRRVRIRTSRPMKK